MPDALSQIIQRVPNDEARQVLATLRAAFQNAERLYVHWWSEPPLSRLISFRPWQDSRSHECARLRDL